MTSYAIIKISRNDLFGSARTTATPGSAATATIDISDHPRSRARVQSRSRRSVRQPSDGDDGDDNNNNIIGTVHIIIRATRFRSYLVGICYFMFCNRTTLRVGILDARCYNIVYVGKGRQLSDRYHSPSTANPRK